MTNEQFAKFLNEKFAEIIATRNAAHEEYATDQDVFHNFNEDSRLIGITSMQSLHILLSKHQRTISRYVRGDNVENRESIEGRIKDAILYLLLLWGMVAEESKTIKTNFIRHPDESQLQNIAFPYTK